MAGTVALGSTGRKRQNIPHGPYRQTDISRKCRDYRESENRWAVNHPGKTGVGWPAADLPVCPRVLRPSVPQGVGAAIY